MKNKLNNNRTIWCIAIVLLNKNYIGVGVPCALCGGTSTANDIVVIAHRKGERKRCCRFCAGLTLENLGITERLQCSPPKKIFPSFLNQIGEALSQ